jgi:tRNA-2-methylthio-N6-dimethylallyladenosine synthase
MKEVGYYTAFMFQYSERPNTKAARRYPDDVPAEVKSRRLDEVIKLHKELSLASNKADLGKEFEVLVEGFSKKSKAELTGRTQQNKVVVFPAGGHKTGDYVWVKVESCTSATLIGKEIIK